MASEQDQAPNAAKETEDEPVISMVDYLKEEEELENDAEAVLGDCDDSVCTYPVGYKGRQAVYACSTCTPASQTPAGICLACSYACHEGHDLFELYTKRNFCCDCGNAKFPEKCKLFPDKKDYNTENQYNQNFSGVYCTCARPYPDPDDDVEDEMIQCIICEDWYHGRHLGDNKPVDHNFQEMICPGCMSKHEFLWAYTADTEKPEKVKTESSNSEVDVGVEDKSSAEPQRTNSSGTDTCSTTAQAENGPNPDTKLEAAEEEKKEEQCFLAELQKREIKVNRDNATYWPEGFRTKLCTCAKCKVMYTEQKVEFLPDVSDTVTAYEQRGLEKRVPTQDNEMKVLEGMNRVQQIEMIQGFNDMKSALSEYLKHFAENGKVVRSEDIQEFFQQMQARKRQKTSHAPAYFCK